MDSLTINTKYFDGDKIFSHRSAMEKLSRGISIYILEVNEDLLHLHKYCEEFIFPLKHHKQSTEAGYQDITTC